ncbi:hypothetical protein BU23DRAFT_563365 [Bimuria novae-zelandiae CBS 107.79]|uniref:Uncharacterized protein n=1 Tax=Bimuria novae-zelandiae CBS 107.79 TaxID=1447943 RepID=A0A6A5VRD1_9PLEO|nr:hypothetical protein BU23DRAFT_563365 [Bimuria novae-zelandiae CBS 107.79]
MPRKPETPTNTRFVTYCIVSLICVAIFQIRANASVDVLPTVLWFIPAPFALWQIFSAMDHYAYDRRCCVQGSTTPCPQVLCIVQLALLLPLLGQVATWIQTFLAVTVDDANLGADVQACAIHFALPFLVVFECEFYRMYWIDQGRELPLPYSAIFRAIREANQDGNFEESRDCIGYAFTVPESEISQREMSGWFPPRWHGIDAADLILFHVMGMQLFGLISRPLLGIPEPDSVLLTVFQIFYTARYPSSILLCVLLQRPIRLLARMIFSYFMGLSHKFWRLWRGVDNSQQEDQQAGASARYLERCAAHRALLPTSSATVRS